MTPPRLTVAEVIRSCLDEFLERYGPELTPEQRRALKDLTSCRTAALGGHVLGCPECGHQQIAYNSCGNRHCPTCQATAAARWLEARAAELLPVPYFHLVFTLPDALDPIALANPRVVYDLLLRSAAETVLEVAADPKHLGAQTGVLAVLHTWGQNLQFHPHVHCVVPGGGLSPDGTRWVASPSNFFLPVRVLSRVFRGKFLAGLRAAFAKRRAPLRGRPVRAGVVRSRPHRLGRLCQAAVRRSRTGVEVSGSVHPSRGDQQCPLARLRGRHGPLPLQGLCPRESEAGHDADGRGVRPATVAARAADGVQRIRHYGILANRHRQAKLALCRQLLGSGTAAEPESAEETRETRESPSSITPTRVCPGLWRGTDDRDQGIPADAGRTGGSRGGWVVRRLRQFVTGREESRHHWVLQNDRRERRSGDSLCRVGKTGENRSKIEASRATQGRGSGGETRAKVSSEGLRVAEDPRRASRAGD